MDGFLEFFAAHGLWLTVIAAVGIVVLGILKYAGAFKKLEENIRHICYLAISVGSSLVGSVVYLLCTNSFAWAELFALAASIWALNQAFYSLYANLSLKELFEKIVEWVKDLIKKSGKTDNQD